MNCDRQPLQYDLIVRGGLIVDGTGADPFVADLAVKDGLIAAIGQVEETAAEEIDARGLIVTPGFIDIHTHYDAQAIWSERMSPSSSHGVTTAVMGNCGVGFAPCRERDRGLLINTMEGVEDIPGVVMVEGLTWEWESFPDFLDALERRRHDIDLAVYIPHSPLRVYVMGDRGANHEPATDEDIEQMVALVRTAMQAGAIGFSTSRMSIHRRIDGDYIASYGAEHRELMEIGREVGRHGGVFQLSPALVEMADEAAVRADFDFLRRLSKEAGVPVTFSWGQSEAAPQRLGTMIEWIEAANRDPEVRMRAQLSPRMSGMIVGFDLTANPFADCPTHRALASLPFEQKLAELRKLEVRRKIVTEQPQGPTLPLLLMARNFERMYAMDETPDYEPDPESSVAAVARRKQLTPQEVAYDMMLARDGRALLMVALANYASGSLEPLRQLLLRPEVVVALGDGGAHYGMLCDAGYPTFMLTHWVRDRKAGRFSIAGAVRALTSAPASFLGLEDRGELAVGRRADINVIDLDALRVHGLQLRHDLPAGGRRLDQSASGYRRTLVAGRVIRRDDAATDALPGRIVRRRSGAEIDA